MLGILDLRSIGYYKIKQGVLQQNIRKYSRFESVDVLHEQFNKFVNTLKKEKENTKEKNPWLEKDNERRSMLDKEILENYVVLCKVVWGQVSFMSCHILQYVVSLVCICFVSCYLLYVVHCFLLLCLGDLYVLCVMHIFYFYFLGFFCILLFY